MKPEAPLHALADTVAEVEASTLYESLSNFKAEALVDTEVSDTEGEAETKALVDKLLYILTSVGCKALVDTVVVTLA